MFVHTYVYTLSSETHSINYDCVGDMFECCVVLYMYTIMPLSSYFLHNRRILKQQFVHFHIENY